LLATTTVPRLPPLRSISLDDDGGGEGEDGGLLLAILDFAMVVLLMCEKTNLG
jgi:hypothetical protein